MFTGIVEEVGTVAAVAANRLEVTAEQVLEHLRLGDSVSVNGCCLTVTDITEGGFGCDLMGETLARTALGELDRGDPVNLERALPADGRFGGHIVQGHVDAVGTIVRIQPESEWTVMQCTLPAAIAPYVVEKGSIAVDGTSLTVMATDDETFVVGLIPHTLEHTTFGRRAVGDRVNLEADVVAKYVERLLR